MAPEQARFDAADVGTRADIYALGVILYELLTGITPIPREALRKAALDEVLRVIREQDPPAPSSRLSTLDAAPGVAAVRQTEPRKLGRLVRGDLDWIAMKCLAKDRDRRYETAAGLARDIERFLNREPVSAGPPTAGYRLRKFVARNKGPVIAAGLVLLALVAGIAGTTWGLVEAREAAAAEKAANEVANDRLTQAGKGNAILTAIFADLDIRSFTRGDRPLEVLLADRLVAAADQLDGEAIGDPVVVANLQNRLGQSLLNLGFDDRATPLLEKSRATLTAALGPDDRDTLRSLNNLANAHQKAERPADAVPLHEECLGRRRAALGPDGPDTITSLNNLGLAYQQVGRVGEAVRLAEEAHRRITAKLSPTHPGALEATESLANTYLLAGRTGEAVPLAEACLQGRRDRLGPDHTATLRSMHNLAEHYRRAGRPADALPLLAECLRQRRGKIGPTHPETLSTVNNLVLIHAAAGRVEELVRLLEEAHRAITARGGSDHSEALRVMNNLGYGYVMTGRVDDALPLLEGCLHRRRAKIGPDHPETLDTASTLAEVYLGRGRVGEALPLYAELVAGRRKQPGVDTPVFAGALAEISSELLAGGQFAAAEPYLRECLAVREKVIPDAWNTFNTRSVLGGCLLRQGKPAEAEPLLLAGYEGMKARAKDIPPPGRTRLPEAADRLVELYKKLNKPDEVAKWRAERATYPSVAPLPRPAGPRS
ncbi:MAG: tetratricopeptide repeat protein [Gemmataceae bacterium]|nr:tetratricopeptide repeat protein [Gemmataceae bacterium]